MDVDLIYCATVNCCREDCENILSSVGRRGLGGRYLRSKGLLGKTCDDGSGSGSGKKIMYSVWYIFLEKTLHILTYSRRIP